MGDNAERNARDRLAVLEGQSNFWLFKIRMAAHAAAKEWTDLLEARTKPAPTQGDPDPALLTTLLVSSCPCRHVGKTCTVSLYLQRVFKTNSRQSTILQFICFYWL